VIPTRLGRIQAGVLAPFRKQFLVPTVLGDSAVLEDDDPVRERGDTYPVRYHNDGLIARHLGISPENIRLGEGIEIARRLVKNNKIALAVIGAADGDFLPFAAGKIDPADVLSQKRLFVGRREPGEG